MPGACARSPTRSQLHSLCSDDGHLRELSALRLLPSRSRSARAAVPEGGEVFTSAVALATVNHDVTASKQLTMRGTPKLIDLLEHESGEP